MEIWRISNPARPPSGQGARPPNRPLVLGALQSWRAPHPTTTTTPRTARICHYPRMDASSTSGPSPHTEAPMSSSLSREDLRGATDGRAAPTAAVLTLARRRRQGLGPLGHPTGCATTSRAVIGGVRGDAMEDNGDLGHGRQPAPRKGSSVAPKPKGMAATASRPRTPAFAASDDARPQVGMDCALGMFDGMPLR